jgi:hypothetical protein
VETAIVVWIGGLGVFREELMEITFENSKGLLRKAGPHES